MHYFYFFRILLKFVIEELKNDEFPFLYSLALQLYGTWMEETKSEAANDIIRKYFYKVKTKVIIFLSNFKNKLILMCDLRIFDTATNFGTLSIMDKTAVGMKQKTCRKKLCFRN